MNKVKTFFKQHKVLHIIVFIIIAIVFFIFFNIDLSRIAMRISGWFYGIGLEQGSPMID